MTDLLGHRKVAIDFKREHRTKLVSHVFGCPRMIRVTRQARVQDSLYPGMTLEPFGDLQSGLALLSQSEFKRLDAALQQKALEATEHRPSRILDKVQFFMQRRTTGC